MGNRWRFAVVLAGGLALAAAGLAAPGTAHAANPVPLPKALAGHPYAFTKSGREIYSWGAGPETPGNCFTPNRRELTFDGTDAVLATSGRPGDCIYAESLHPYPTADGYVYETRAYFSNWTQWDSFWMYGRSWPADGEIDAVEGIAGINFLSYHYGQPGAYSACNRANGCDPGGALPMQAGPFATPGSSASQYGDPDIAPGWHTVDISYGRHGAGQGEVCVWYDGAEFGCVYGTNVLHGGSQHDPYWFTWDTGSCASAHNGNTCNTVKTPDPGYVKVAWIRGFT